MCRGGRPPHLTVVATTLTLLTIAACVLAGCVETREPDPAPAGAGTGTGAGAAANASTRAAIATPLSDEEVTRLLRQAVCWYDDPALAATCLPPGEPALAAIEALGQSGDLRLAAPLIDLLSVDAGWDVTVRHALRTLTGLDINSASDGYEWLESALAGSTPPNPLPETAWDYATWKARLLMVTAGERRDVSYSDLITRQLPLHEVALLAWTGVQPGDQPALSASPVVGAEAQLPLQPDEPVFGVVVGREARAYPLRIVAWHSAINDEVGGLPLLLAYCLPCGGAAAFDRRGDGGTLTFGDSGLVRSSRTVLFDDRSRLWDAFGGTTLHRAPEVPAEVLTPLPLVVTTWGEWAARFPTTGVLAPDTGVVREYEPGAALKVARQRAGHPPEDRPLYAAGGIDPRLPALIPVVGVTLNGESRAYRLDAAEQARLRRDTLGGEAITLLSTGPGGGVSLYRTGEIVIEHLEGSGAGLRAVDTAGERWFVSPRALIATIDGREVAAIPARIGYWFAWAAVAPGTDIAE